MRVKFLAVLLMFPMGYYTAAQMEQHNSVLQPVLEVKSQSDGIFLGLGRCDDKKQALYAIFTPYGFVNECRVYFE